MVLGGHDMYRIGGLSAAFILQLAKIAKHFFVLVSASLFCTGLFPSFAKEFFRFICTLTFKVHGDIDFLLPSHIAFPRFVVRLVPLHHPVNLLGFWRTRIPCGEILQIFPDRLLGYVAVLIKDIKIFKTKVSQFNFRAVDFKILEPVDSFSLTKNVFGTQVYKT